MIDRTLIDKISDFTFENKFDEAIEQLQILIESAHTDEEQDMAKKSEMLINFFRGLYTETGGNSVTAFHSLKSIADESEGELKADASVMVATMYLGGSGVEKNLGQAAYYAKQGWDLGQPSAKRLYASILLLQCDEEEQED